MITRAALLTLSLCIFPCLVFTDDASSPFEPIRERVRVEKIQTSQKRYEIDVGGTVDMNNTTTRFYETFRIAFQNNVSLTIANTGDVTVKNPRVITNGKRRWSNIQWPTDSSLLWDTYRVVSRLINTARERSR